MPLPLAIPFIAAASAGVGGVAGFSAAKGGQTLVLLIAAFIAFKLATTGKVF